MRDDARASETMNFKTISTGRKDYPACNSGTKSEDKVIIIPIHTALMFYPAIPVVSTVQTPSLRLKIAPKYKLYPTYYIFCYALFSNL